MTTLGALSQAWTSAEASLPLDWQLTGLTRLGDRLRKRRGEGNG